MSENKGVTVDQASKVAFFKELDILKKRYEKLELKRNALFMQRTKCLGKEFSTLDDYEKILSEGRKITGQKYSLDLNKIKNQIDALQTKLKNQRPNPTYVKILKVQVEQLEKNINMFKNQGLHIYDQLLKQERDLNLQLKIIEQKFEVWDNKPYVINISSQRFCPKSIIKDLPAPITNFERFVQRTGSYGGWTNIDHEIFLSIWNKTINKQNIVAALLPFLPLQSSDDITSHAQWYQKYGDLLERKKNCIQLWKRDKQTKNSNKLKSQDANLMKQDTENQKSDKKVQEEEEKLRQKVLKKLQKWKDYKEAQKTLIEEQKLIEELQKKEDLKKQKRRQLVNKLKLQHLKLEMESREKLLQERKIYDQQMEEYIKQCNTMKTLKEFRQKDCEFLQKRQFEKKFKEDEALKQKQRVENVKSQIAVDVKRDFKRLLQPTQVCLERMKCVDKSYDGPQIYIPHRAIPSWRQQE